MIAPLALLGMVLSAMAYWKTKPLLVYRRMDIALIVALELSAQVLFAAIFIGALFGMR